MNDSDEEKIKRLLDAQEHPEHYTDEELRESYTMPDRSPN